VVAALDAAVREAGVTEAYPLHWPAHVKRRTPAQRIRAAFGKTKHVTSQSGGGWPKKERLTIADAVKRALAELDRLGARYAVISSNVEIRQDGLPRSNRPEPDDPGVAVYFQLNGRPYCLPCDRYDRVADNIAAIAHHIDATRAIERYGVGTVEQAFQGFAGLPPPKTWRQILGFNGGAVTVEQVDERYRELARRHHPDAGGDHGLMAEINAARAAAREELGPA
jgi:hypothetical protein